MSKEISQDTVYATAFTAQEYSIILKALERYEFYLKNFVEPDKATLDCIETIADKIDNRLSRGSINVR